MRLQAGSSAARAARSGEPGTLAGMPRPAPTIRRTFAATRVRRRSLANSPHVRHSLTAKAPARSGGTTIAVVLGTIGLVVAMLATGVIGTAAVVTVASINVLSQDLPDPAALADPHVRPADGRLRPDRQDRARPLPAGAAAVVDVRATSRSSCSMRRRPPRTARSGRTTASTSRPSSPPRSATAPAATSAARRRSPSSSSGRGCCRRTSSRPAPTSTCARPRSSSSRRASRRRSPARPARSRSSPPTSTRSSTATTRTGSRPPPRSTSASPTSRS